MLAGLATTAASQCGCTAQVYTALARALGCLVLFFFANLLKTLGAKIMATSFHTEAHFKKMQEALQKARHTAC